MASLAVMYVLCLVVLTPRVSEAKHEDSNILTFGTRRKIEKISDPLYESTKHVKEGRNITFLCFCDCKNSIFWYRNDRENKAKIIAVSRCYQGACTVNVTEKILENLRSGNTSCINKSCKLQIRNVDQNYEGGWYCLVDNKWQSGYIDLKVNIHDEVSTTRRTQAPTTSTVKVTVSKHGILSSKAAEDTREDTTERTHKGSAPRKTLAPLIGGAAGGVIFLLVLVITAYALYRSKRRLSHPDDGHESSCSNRQLGIAEAGVLEGNPLYSSSPGSDDYAEIVCRGPAASSHEKGEASVVKNKNNHDDRNQPGQDSGDIYAIPDKPKKSAAEDIGEASVVKNKPNLGDRNQSQPGQDSGDIYAVPDKPKKSASEDVEEVYSQVQKPKK